MLNRPDFTVATLGELVTLHVAELIDGANVWVTAANDYFTLIKQPSVTPVIDNENILSPIAGSPIAGAASSVWVRSSMTTTLISYGIQSAWFIDPTNGLDTNNGAAAVQGVGDVGPLKTRTEWFRRLSIDGGIAPNTSVTLQFLGTPAATDTPIGIIRIAIGSRLDISGTPTNITPVGAGIITTAVVCAPATNVSDAMTDANLSAANFWTAQAPQSTTSVGRRIRLLAGSVHPNTVCWPAVDMGAKKCETTAPILANSVGGVFAAAIEPLSLNDPYALEQLTQINSWDIGFQIDGAFIGSGSRQAVTMTDIWFPNQVSIPLQGSSPGLSWSLGFYNCDLAGTAGEGPTAYVNCRIVQPVFRETDIVLGGMGVAIFQVLGATIIDLRFRGQAGEGLITGGMGGAIGSICAYDSTNHGIDHEPSCQPWYRTFFSAHVEIFGQRNGGVPFQLHPGVLISIDASGAVAAMAGVGGPVLIGTASKTWAQALAGFYDQDFAGASSKLTGIAAT